MPPTCCLAAPWLSRAAPEKALAPLTKAAEIQPTSPEPHAFLADAFTQLGRTADAEHERSEAQRLRAAAKR